MLVKYCNALNNILKQTFTLINIFCIIKLLEITRDEKGLGSINFSKTWKHSYVGSTNTLTLQI